MTRFYVTEQLSENMYETPEKFLVCANVPITRTGILLYAKGETPLEADDQGQVQIERYPEDVFREETIQSFEGKPITINHPDDFVTPENWKSLTVGSIQNVRKGEDDSNDYLLADLLINTQEAIALVKAGLREVSCGYDAEYVQEGPGRGKQTSIIGNHLALVNKGRAGAQCSIQDSHPCIGCGKCKSKTHDSKEVTTMTFKDKLKKVFHFLDEMKEEDLEELKKKETGDEDIPGQLTALKEAIDELEESDKKLHEQMDSWGKSGKGKDAEETEEEKKAREKKEKEDTKDSDEEEEKEKKKDDEKKETKDAISRAAIITPTLKFKDSDKAIDIKKKSLSHALTTDSKSSVELFTMGKDIDKMTKDALDAAFMGASTLISRENNANFQRSGISTKDFGPTNTPAAINKANSAFWAARKSN